MTSSLSGCGKGSQRAVGFVDSREVLWNKLLLNPLLLDGSKHLMCSFLQSFLVPFLQLRLGVLVKELWIGSWSLSMLLALQGQWQCWKLVQAGHGCAFWVHSSSSFWLLALQENPHAGKVFRVLMLQQFIQERTAYLCHGVETPFSKEWSAWTFLHVPINNLSKESK